jgi:predicted O-methyltransferase YrrM
MRRLFSGVTTPLRKGLLGFLVRHLHKRHIREVLNAHDLDVCRLSDFYSPLPSVAALERHRDRWLKPSRLLGIRYDLDAMEILLERLVAQYAAEFEALGAYDTHKATGYGPGFPRIDSLVLYLMARDRKPSRVLEIGAGLSTFYLSLAAQANAREGRPLRITSVEPSPRKQLWTLPGVSIIDREAQDAPSELFDELGEGDLLFIDSTHIVKLDGEVPYLCLEILPRLRPGVLVHVHDVHFPYNIPHPAELYVFGWERTRWPVFWNEAMLVQAFLCFNDAFRILLSLPILRFEREAVLRDLIPGYRPIDPGDQGTHFGSLWIERIR